MRTTGKIFFCALFVCFALAFMSPGTATAKKGVESIEAVIGDSDSCSSVGGKFDATYLGRKIDVLFYFESKTDKRGIQLYKGDKEMKKGLEEFLCPPKDDKKIAISGKKARMEGEWRDLNTFIAYEIYLPDEKPEKKQ
jgi:hypothetical protein